MNGNLLNQTPLDQDLGSVIAVTSREVAWFFLKEFRFELVPVFHGLQGRFALQNGLWELLIIEPDITVYCRIKVFP